MLLGKRSILMWFNRVNRLRPNIYGLRIYVFSPNKIRAVQSRKHEFKIELTSTKLKHRRKPIRRAQKRVVVAHLPFIFFAISNLWLYCLFVIFHTVHVKITPPFSRCPLCRFSVCAYVAAIMT